MTPRARRTRTAALLALLLAVAGLAFWLPVLATLLESGGREPVGSGWGVRMTQLAVRQFGPEMQPVALVLGTLLALVSVVQVPACLGTLALRRWGTRTLQAVALAELGLYLVAAAVVLAGVLHYHHRGLADWQLSAATFGVNVLVLLFYYWLLHALVAPVSFETPATPAPARGG